MTPFFFTSLGINVICAALTCNTFFSVKSAYYCVVLLIILYPAEF